MIQPFKKYLLLSLIAVIFYQDISAVPIQCGLETNCIKSEDSEICLLEESNDSACIRKYPSKCHLDIAACKQGKNFTDFSANYCALKGFACEEGYERWTIFFDQKI